MSTSDNLVTLESRRSRLTPLEAMTMALEGAQERGRAGDPRVILDCLPDRWGLVDADATAANLANVLEELVGPWDELPPEALAIDEHTLCRCGHREGRHARDGSFCDPGHGPVCRCEGFTPA